MTVGKPNFNLNSFGVKYLSKDEIQEFLEKYEVPHGDDQAALRTERENQQGGKFQASESSKKLLTPTTPKPKETPAVATSSTRSQFMSRETPSKLSHTERKLRQDMESSGTKVDTSGIVTQRQKPQPETKPNEGKAPNRPTEHIGSIVDGGKVQGMDSKGNKRTISDASVKKEPKERSSSETTGKKGTKQLPKHVGDAPKGTKSEKELVGGRNVKVGVGSEAHEKLEKDPQGELTESQKPKENKPDGRKVDLNTQHRSSKGVQSHNKRGKENSKWYSEEQRAAYKKIDSKDRNAQAKFHSEQEKKYGKSVDTPKKLSSAGQAIKDKLKKSNYIILDMNIMKLDLMKNKPKKGNLVQDRAGQAIKQINSTAVKEKREKEMVMPTNNLLEHIHSKTKVPEGKGSPNDLGKSASETIFKAISLKLDLTTLK